MYVQINELGEVWQLLRAHKSVQNQMLEDQSDVCYLPNNQLDTEYHILARPAMFVPSNLPDNVRWSAARLC